MKTNFVIRAIAPTNPTFSASEGYFMEVEAVRGLDVRAFTIWVTEDELMNDAKLIKAIKIDYRYVLEREEVQARIKSLLEKIL